MKKRKKKIQTIEKEQLITILRKPSGLYALINRPKYPFTMSLYRPGVDNTSEELSDFFESIEMSLQDISKRVFPQKYQLLQWWKQAHELQKPTLPLFTSLLQLLQHTQQAPDTGLVTPRCVGFDPMAFLFNCNYRNRVFVNFFPLLNEAAKVVCSTSDIRWAQKDPYWSFNFPEIETIPKLPTSFKLFVLPLLKGELAQRIPEWIGLYRSLELDRNEKLLHSISRMLKLGQENFVRSWCKQLLMCVPNRREIAATLVVQTKMYECPPETFGENILADFFKLSSKKNAPSRLYYFLLALRKGLHADYIFDGLRLSNRYCPEYKFNDFNKCDSFEYKTTVQLTDYIRSFDSAETTLPLLIWERWSNRNGFYKSISNPIYFRIGAKVATDLINFIVDDLYFFANAKNSLQFSTLANCVLPNVFQILQREIPRKYRVKFCNGLKTLFFEAIDVKDCVDYLLPLSKAVQRLCKSTFDVEAYPFELIWVFIKNTKSLWSAFLSAPDSSFLALEKSCRRNDMRLIKRGIRTLLKLTPLLTIKSFRLFPRKLFDVAKLLGVFSYPERIRIVKGFLSSPEGSQRFRKLNLCQTWKWLREYSVSGVSNPMPNVLSKFVKGEYRLTPARVQRYRRILFENLNLTRLELLEQCIEQNLTKSFSATSISGLQHAMQILRVIRKNRRQLKKFLRSYVQGNKLYSADHPRTQEWIREHSMIDFGAWQKGIVLSTEVENYGSIRISLESDPLEVLKMGTYAGSCLGLGGENAFSAAAVMLDINKQVLYARNTEGKVIARQLIAISEDNKLVCFNVYPVRINKSIQQLFRKYDRRFAKTLNVELSRSRSDYEIRKILSQAWYDDFAWNLKV